MAKKTRQGLIGIARGLYGSFVGKVLGVFTGPSFNLKAFLDITGESVRGAIDNEGEAVQSSQIGEFAVQSNLDINGQLIRVSLNTSGQSLIAAMDNTGIALEGNIEE